MLANVDGLVDYGGDFTDAATVLPDMKTLYEVGKGILRADPEAAPSEPEPGGEAIETAQQDEDAPAEAVAPPEPQEENVDIDAPQDVAAEAEEVPAPRRMKFRFGEA
ncbi:MAG: hypothetical protein AAFY59_04325 [Pseudomonadota bacterium]